MHIFLNKALIALPEKPLWKLWLLFFLYAAFVGLFVQLILLPHIMPAWHAGNGLLNSYSDSVIAHKMASHLAERINLEGWAVWELRPELQGQVGITAAIYAITVSKPWVLIPLLAALHATATLALLLVIDSLLCDRQKSLLAILPFFLYPSAISWYTQLLKDGYGVAGFSLILYAWTKIADQQRTWRGFKLAIGPIALLVAGVLLVWLARPYMVNIILLLSLTAVIFLTIVTTFRYFRQQDDRRVLLSKLTILWMTLVIIVFLKPSADPVKQTLAYWNVETVREQVKAVPEQVEIVLKQRKAVRENETHSMKDVFVNAYEWLSETGSIMVNSMESKLIALAFAREGFRNVPANLSVSKIDSEVKLTTVKGVLSYLPRAAQIAFLSPFPQHWFGTGSLEANTMMRRIAAFEMLGVYFCLIFLPYAIWFWRQKAEVWLVLIYCVPPLLMQGVVVANIGTLYRLRYGFLMALVALGLAGFLTLIQRIKTRVTGGL